MPAAQPSGLRRLDARLAARPRLVAAALLSLLAVQGGAVVSHDTSTNPKAVAEVAPAPLVPPSPLAVPAAPAPRAAPVVKARVPVTHPVRKKKAKPVTRWLPSGTGMWLHEFENTEGGDARAIVARARAAGLSTLYVQTGSSKKGWIGTPALRALLPATRGTGLKIVAWDFPKLADPVTDARRLARAVQFRCPGCPRVAAVAPDVETAAEGTRVGDRAVARYYSALRTALPADIAILATVPWPSEKRVGKYPYARTASLVDALLPMAYWYNRSPAVVTATSMGFLSRYRKPVMPVGQGYDSRIDAPYLPIDPDPRGSVQEFLDTARARGAAAVSLWSWQSSGDHQWAALRGAKRSFRLR